MVVVVLEVVVVVVHEGVVVEVEKEGPKCPHPLLSP